MKYTLILLVFIFGCKKKDPEPAAPTPAPTPAPIVTPTVTPKPDTIPRVTKTIEFYFDTYCNYKGTILIKTDDDDMESMYDTIFTTNTKDTVRKTFTTRRRYLFYSFSSYDNIQTPSGYLPCKADFVLKVNGTEIKKYTGVSGAYEAIDLYK